jgi:hypothetical protein
MLYRADASLQAIPSQFLAAEEWDSEQWRRRVPEVPVRFLSMWMTKSSALLD